ncbi:hypothetical protein SAMN05216388_1011107 [Halorientalis persicus]|jgi:hypothetical protein|uniref:Uncharacterized protein n=1 Tax=Halorientalis persicus TaxID=1367881 RepID=A0A1H8P035_9EURY|nr:hypothetical protein [Halorientalis persicus]SEO35121.1 hypothetical protein SAMN05216388_1011107 [Halorientalis persicus]
MVETVAIARGVLVLMRLVTFGLTLGITLISFQAYRKKQSEKLQSAFIGFAFISMGVAITNVITQLGAGGGTSSLQFIFLQMTETIPFIIGFAMLYLSLYR